MNFLQALRCQRLRSCISAGVVMALLLQTIQAAAPAPVWWGTQGVLDTASAKDDYTIANVGQLKAVAQKAALELRATLGSEGAEIASLIQSWENPPVAGVDRNDFTAVNAGMLKNVASKFYDRLRLFRNDPVMYPYAYPWPVVKKTDCATVTASSILTLPATTGMGIGQAVFGPGIPATAVVSSITSSTQLVLSQPATASGSGIICLFLQPGTGQRKTGGTLTTGSDLLNLSSTADLAVGMCVFGAGMPEGACIAAIPSSTQVKLTAPSTQTVSTAQDYFFCLMDDYALVNLGQLKNVFSFSAALAGDPVFFDNSTTNAAWAAALNLALSSFNGMTAPPSSSPYAPGTTNYRAVGSTNSNNTSPSNVNYNYINADFNGDRIPNGQAFRMGIPILDVNDVDGDRITNVTENLWDGNGTPAGDALPYSLNRIVPYDAVADPDGDKVMNFEEIRLGLTPGSLTAPTARADGLNDTLVLAWGLLHGSASLAPSTDAIQDCWSKLAARTPAQQTAWFSSFSLTSKTHWLVTTDTSPADGVPDGLAAFRSQAPTLLAAHLTLPTLGPTTFNPRDSDQDGMKDIWEYRYQLDVRADDSALDPDHDGLTNLMEFDSSNNGSPYYSGGTNPLLADTDGDGFSDKGEKETGTSPRIFNLASTVQAKVYRVGESSQSRFIGLKSDALTVRVHKGGIPQPNVNVTYSITNSNPATWGRLDSYLGGISATGTLIVPTNSDGYASVTLTGYQAGSVDVVASATVGDTTSSAYFTVNVQSPPAAMTSISGNFVNNGGGSGGGGFAAAQNNAEFDNTFTTSSDGMMLELWDKWYSDTSDEKYTKVGLIGKNGWSNFAFGGYTPPHVPTETPSKSWGVHAKFILKPPAATSNGAYGANKPAPVRSYLVLYYEGPDGFASAIALNNPPKKIGTLTFTYDKAGTPVITKGGDTSMDCKVKGGEVIFEAKAADAVEKRHTFVLLPVEIKRDVAGGIVSWESITGTVGKALPGQKINLKIFLPDGITATDFHWSMSGGKFKNYSEPRPSGSHVVPLEASDLTNTNKEMHFFWSQPGTHTITVNCLIGGVRQYFRQAFEVVAPSCTFTGVQTPIQTGPGYFYRDSCTWTATVDKLPQDFPLGGEWMFVQTVCVTRTIMGTPNKVNQFNGEWCLDTIPGIHDASYAGEGKRDDGQSHSTSDSPFGGADDERSEQFDQKFKTYVMFKSKEDGACWVPLKVMEWDLGFNSTVSSLFGQSFSDSYPQATRNLTGSETHMHPTWSHITSFLMIDQP